MSEESQSKGGNKIVYGLGGALVVAALFVGYLYGQLSALKTTPSKTNDSNVAAADTQEVLPPEPLTEEVWKEVVAKPAAVEGNEKASVTIAEFMDYRCSFCGKYASETYPDIKKNYVDTGKVRYMVRALPFLGEESGFAAQAALCAADQGGDEAYFKFHDKLFENSATLSSATYEKIAGEVGLNAKTLGKCVADGKFADKVKEDMALAMKVGANGTPTFFINGEMLVGAQPYAAFEAAIEAALAN